MIARALHLSNGYIRRRRIVQRDCDQANCTATHVETMHAALRHPRNPRLGDWPESRRNAGPRIPASTRRGPGRLTGIRCADTNGPAVPRE